MKRFNESCGALVEAGMFKAKTPRDRYQHLARPVAIDLTKKLTDVIAGGRATCAL